MKISIAIPTRNRADLLRWSLRSLVEINDPNLEIVVSDNCSSDHTFNVVGEFQDPRIVFVTTKQSVSMRANFENALDFCTGDYISFIGDDDGYLPGQFSLLKDVLKRYSPDCLMWDLPVFSWPQVGEAAKIKLRYRNVFGGVGVVDSLVMRAKLLRAEINQTNWAPSIYHGMVSRRCIEGIRSTDGFVFGGSIPDIYFAYRALWVDLKMLKMSHPFSLGGQSNQSNGWAQSNRDSNSIVRSFHDLNSVDPLRDVLAQRSSIPWVLFSTLETVLKRIGSSSDVVDYASWYAYVLEQERLAGGGGCAETLAVLEKHAQEFGRIDDFKIALSRRNAHRVGFLKRVSHELGNIRSLKIPVRGRGLANIFDAVQIFDSVLGSPRLEDIGSALARERAWYRAGRIARSLVGGGS